MSSDGSWEAEGFTSRCGRIGSSLCGGPGDASHDVGITALALLGILQFHKIFQPLAFAGIALGAFGAHALRSRVGPDLLATFETGVRYHLYHALALLACAWALERWPAPQLSWAAWLFVTGIVLFSGSLYALTLTGARWWGAVTPLGGIAFLAGWLLLAWGIAKGG